MKKSATKVSLVVLCLGVLTFVSALLSGNSLFAAFTFNRAINTTVEVVSEAEVKVTQVHRLSWNNPSFMFPASRNYLYAYIFPAFTSQTESLEDKVTNIQVSSRYAKNRTLGFAQSLEDGAIQLKIPYYENLEVGNDLEFSISYTTSLYTVKQGGILEFSYPGLSKDFKASEKNETEGYTDMTAYTLNVSIPESLGVMSSVYPAPVLQKTMKGKVTVTYNASNLVANSVRLAFGSERFIKFTLSGKTYPTSENTPNFVKGLLVNYIDVALPTQQIGTEFGHQTVYYSKIEPFPVSLTTDIDGNLIARIPVSAAKEGEITVEGYASLRNIPLTEAEKTAQISEIPTTMSAYLASEGKYWQADSAVIQGISSKESDSSGTIYQNVRKTLTFVSQNLTYAKVEKESSLRRLGALDALSAKVGVCMEYSDLSLSILRAQKIPTRAVYGDGVGARVDRTLAGIGHQWIGVWFPNQGWIPADPTWSDNGNEYIGHDFDHFVWYVASKSVDEPSGFNCLSWDSQSPCRDALRIDTQPVDKIPTDSELLTVTDVKELVRQKDDAGKNKITAFLQGIVTYLGGSRVGRALLSNQAMLILFGVGLYTLLVVTIRGVLKAVRNKNNKQD